MENRLVYQKTKLKCNAEIRSYVECMADTFKLKDVGCVCELGSCAEIHDDMCLSIPFTIERESIYHEYSE